MAVVTRVPETLDGIRSSLLDITGDRLGSFDNGTTALHISPPETVNQAVNGILCILQRYPRQLRSRHCVGSRQTRKNLDWVVLFRQYNRNVTPIRLSAAITPSSTTMSVLGLPRFIPKGIRIDFNEGSIVTVSGSEAAAESIEIEQPGVAIAAPQTGIYDPMKDFDDVIKRMKSHYPSARERIVRPTEEGIFPQVSYLINFNQFINHP